MLRFTTGDMFETPADIRVNTVNCVGVMGAGVALAFRNRLPEMFEEYKRECELGHLRPGKLYIWKSLSGDWVINFPTKRHWREKSRYEDIELGLIALRDYLVEQGKVRVTLPALGCGHGGLDWNRVAPMIQEHLQELEAEIIVFDPADSRVIGQQEVNSSSAEVSLLKKEDKEFPPTLRHLGIREIHYKGTASLLNNLNVAVAYSSKPAEREQTVALDCIAELARPGIQFCFVLNNSLATKIAALALEKGSQVVAWIPQGLSRYHLPRVLRPAYSAGNLLLISAAKPHQGWNPGIARQSALASLLTSKLKLVTDPEPNWINQLGEDVLDAMGGRTFYVRYQEIAPNLEKCLRELSARYIGRRSLDGKPNVAPILEALELPVSQEPVTVSPSSQNKKAEITHPSGSAAPPQLFTQTNYQSEQNKIGRYPKRLIEVDLPIKRISEHARREKSIRHGHISTLHIWWARRPLASCRAVICAALWPDPADPLCPQAFRDRAAAIITKFAEKAATQKGLMEHCSNDTRSKWMLLSQPTNRLDPNNEAHLNVMRNALLDFIADFANWDNSTQKDYLEASRTLTQAAHEALGGESGTRPLVVDPFAGGGAIPLEALRVGADAFASDLNPVAVLLNKVLLEYIPKYGQHLADEVRKWGEWIKQEAEKELAEFYPKDDGATPIAYLWARTIQCEGPSCGAEVPLIRNMQITRDGRKWYFTIGETNKCILVSVKEGSIAKDRPTVSGGSATCPRKSCGYTTPAKSVRDQLTQQRGGARKALLLAVYVDSANGRYFRNPTELDRLAVSNANLALDHNSLPKDLINPVRPYKNTRGLSAVTRIGMQSFGDLYTSRQALALLCLQRTLLSIHDEREEQGFIEAVLSTLNCAVSRFVFQNSSLSRWNSARSTIEGAFGKQALQVVWDFAESNPISSGPANWDGAVEWILKVIETNSCIDYAATVARLPAQQQCLPNDSAQALITDPPYFAAIPYADLSNVFYVWERRFLKAIHPDLFADGLVDQQEEIIVTNANQDRSGHLKTPEFYQDEMKRSLQNARQTIAPNRNWCNSFRR